MRSALTQAVPWQTSLQGLREALREVTVLGSYRHPHLVPLVCFCLSRQAGQQEACLVYPLMSGGALDTALADGAARPLGAAARLRIAADAAAGLAYLHAPGGGLGALLHRDVKSSNVLLDEGLRARVSDVGLARPQRGATMTAGVGTFGYIDPEYFDSGERTRPRAWVAGAAVLMRDQRTCSATGWIVCHDFAVAGLRAPCTRMTRLTGSLHASSGSEHRPRRSQCNVWAGTSLLPGTGGGRERQRQRVRI